MPTAYAMPQGISVHGMPPPGLMQKGGRKHLTACKLDSLRFNVGEWNEKGLLLSCFYFPFLVCNNLASAALLFGFYINLGGVQRAMPAREIIIQVQDGDFNVTKLNELANAELARQSPSLNKEYILVRTGGAVINDCPATQGENDCITLLLNYCTYVFVLLIVL